MPGEDHVQSWGEFAAERFAYEYRSDGAFVALDGSKFVGVAHVILDREHDRMENAMTGVLREYRGRGIAQSLKTLTIKHARDNGVSEILTQNDSENGPMLAVNQKLGYRRWPGRYVVKATLN